MRILLDECLPKRLRNELKPHQVSTVPEMGWAGIKNGALLKLAEKKFDVFLTVDQNLTFQQSLTALNLSIITLAAPSNDIGDLRPLTPQVLEVLPNIRSGEVVKIS